ncbi:MAG: ABC transporter substrate-binding protein [Bacteroidales bacterium]|nr:ABC transporter substrate-binding protein [Bacteroidales bacterium]
MIYVRKIFICVVAAFCLTACDNQEDRSHILKVYNWADYIDESVIPEFEEWYKEQTGEEVKVIYQLFDINEIMLSKIERGHDDYDVVCPSDYIIERMLRNNLLLPIQHDFGNTPDYIDNVSPYIKKCFDKIDGSGKNANDYSVGYMWGTTGFLYNADKVKREELSSWSALENPKFHGSMLLKEAFRDVYSVLLTYLRHDDLQSGKITLDQLMYDSSDESIALVENYLKSIKDGVVGWETDFGKEMMTKGETMLNLSWSGDAQWAIEEAGEVGVNLDYVVPDEGSNVWFDGWVIPKYAKNVKAAQYFINFLCRSDIAIRNMNEIGYVSVIGTDEVLQSRIDPENFEPINASYFFGEGNDSICINPVQYPDQSVIDRCAMMHDSGDRTEAMLAMWSRIKGDNANSFTYIIIFMAIAALVTWGVMKKQKKGKHQHKSKNK